jgi:PBSX family phage terminase large subunit
MAKTISQADLKLLAKLAGKEVEAQKNPFLKYTGGWVPNPWQQRLINCEKREILAGGAAGASKSVGLLFCAIRYMHIPNYHAIIFRRTFAELKNPNGLIPISMEWLSNTDAKWKSDENRWYFPNGSTLSFGHIESRRDLQAYQSSAYHSILFDEVTQFEPFQYLYMFSRCRRRAHGESSKIPLHIISATNPGGPSHNFFKDRFITNNDDPENRIYIPGKYTDNPYTDHTEYKKMLSVLDPITRAQLECGEWIENTDALVYKYTPKCLVDRLPDYPREQWSFYLGIDLGYKDATAFVVLATHPELNDVYVVLAEKHKDLIFSKVAERIMELEVMYGFQAMVIDAANTQGIQEIVQRYYLPLTPAQKRGKMEFIKLFNSDLQSGKLLALKGETAPLIKEWENHYYKNDLGKEESTVSENHAADACLYVWRYLKHQATPTTRTPKPGDPSYEDHLFEQHLQNRLEELALENEFYDYLYN